MTAGIALSLCAVALVLTVVGYVLSFRAEQRAKALNADTQKILLVIRATEACTRATLAKNERAIDQLEVLGRARHPPQESAFMGHGGTGHQEQTLR